ncbi:MAG: hypothetical protein R3E48_05335 [Burkholderiaceae bacterium]
MLDEIRKAYGLDKPVYQQFLTYMGRAVHGDLGQSYLFNLTVMDLIPDRDRPDHPAGAHRAGRGDPHRDRRWRSGCPRRPDSVASGAVTIFSLVGYAMPVFWTGILLVLLFGKVIPTMPIAGMRDVRSRATASWPGSTWRTTWCCRRSRSRSSTWPCIAGFAREHARGAGPGLHPNRTREGAGRERRHLQARIAHAQRSWSRWPACSSAT